MRTAILILICTISASCPFGRLSSLRRRPTYQLHFGWTSSSNVSSFLCDSYMQSICCTNSVPPTTPATAPPPRTCASSSSLPPPYTPPPSRDHIHPTSYYLRSPNSGLSSHTIHPAISAASCLSAHLSLHARTTSRHNHIAPLTRLIMTPD